MNKDVTVNVNVLKLKVRKVLRTKYLIDGYQSFWAQVK